jgi:uncharacterized protein (DUF488 family)
MKRIRTIGHSTHPLAEFIALLEENAIALLVDVRRFPGSRRNPQYHTEALAASLSAAGIDYRHFPELGGRRRALPDSRNGVWRNPAFRGYADHMASAEFRQAFDALQALAEQAHTAIMCAELLWWRCHRSMIADDLTLHGWEVRHILGPGQVTAHAFREPAHLVDDVPVYDGGQPTLL